MIKVNLGCGKKLKRGWVNIDVKAPDDVHKIEKLDKDSAILPNSIYFMELDLKDLGKIEDNSVDIIEAIHVVEHFYLWEVGALLSEWQRVLKPNGKLVIECPDIIKCAKNFLQVETTQNPELFYNLGIMGFFGDPQYHDPLMCHKWGWFPASLTQMLHKVGFVNITQEKSQYHMGDMRDFRLEGYKNES